MRGKSKYDRKVICKYCEKEFITRNKTVRYCDECRGHKLSYEDRKKIQKDYRKRVKYNIEKLINRAGLRNLKVLKSGASGYGICLKTQYFCWGTKNLPNSDDKKNILDNMNKLIKDLKYNRDKLKEYWSQNE